ncbi:MAG: HAMP domain-containing histidine kinase [Puniceicoccales bacterium]|jgi:signal transduction histidine kinase|nr:HAMP domain-containing histidine kinase [Puniceicoccales bacterium]
MAKGIHPLFFLFYASTIGFLLLWNVNPVITLIVSILFLWKFYYFHRKCLEKSALQSSMLYEVAQVRGIFMSVASHELRNPMATIYSSVDLLENYPHNLIDAEKARLFESIRKNIRRMTKMMDNIVTIGKLQHKQIFCHPEEIDILSLCTTICETLEPEKQRIEITINEQLPETFKVDSSLIDLILGNLLSNALKYSDQPVKLFINFKDRLLIFDVIDQGIGIPMDEIKKLSQLFGRCSNTGTRRGIGIGMFLVSHCVKLHRGKLQIRSQENRGTHFKITLPIFDAQDTAY